MWVHVRTASVRRLEAVLTSTHNVCFGSKIRKLGIPLQTPVFLHKVGFKGVILHKHVFLMYQMSCNLKKKLSSGCNPVQHKSGCTITEESKDLEILNLKKRHFTIHLVKTRGAVIAYLICAFNWGRVGDSRAKVQGNYLLSVPAVQGKLWGFDIRILTPGRFSIAEGGAKSKVLTSSLPPWGGAYSRALKAEKL